MLTYFTALTVNKVQYSNRLNIQGELVPSVTREMSIKLHKKAPAMVVVVA